MGYLIIKKIKFKHCFLVILSIVFISIFWLGSMKLFFAKRDVFYKVKEFKIKENPELLMRFIQNEYSENQTLDIFFVETNPYRDEFDERQLCAIESAAFTNPTSIVKVYSLKAKLQMEILSSYPNVQYIEYQIEEIFKDTLLESFWNKSKRSFFDGKYAVSHLSDMLRFTLIWKYGGFYSDLDTITIKSVSSLFKFPGLGYLEDHAKVGSGILAFPKSHPLLYEALKEIKKNYDAEQWGANGPLLLSRLIKSYCNVEIESLSERDTLDLSKAVFENYLDRVSKKSPTLNKLKECNVWIYHTKHFYPVNWQNAAFLFERNQNFSIKQFIDAYSIHFFNKITSKFYFVHGANNIFEYFASTFCPRTYSLIRQLALDKTK
jgi:lactosylceramide 4-alpha-galactosyltransferase